MNPTSVDAARDGTDLAGADQLASPPWWRVGMVWLVLGGPLLVVIASLGTAVLAWRDIDPVVSDPSPRHARPAEHIDVPASPKDASAPAMNARNHVATP